MAAQPKPIGLALEQWEGLEISEDLVLVESARPDTAAWIGLDVAPDGGQKWRLFDLDTPKIIVIGAFGSTCLATYLQASWLSFATIALITIAALWSTQKGGGSTHGSPSLKSSKDPP